MKTPQRLLLLALFACLALAGSAPAAELREPYRLRVVLDVAPHRLLTAVFKQQVARELGDGLQAALGDLGRVEVTEKDPRPEALQKQGLEKGLDGWVDRSPYKSHFVRIDYTGGQYEVRARQYDGVVGLPSSVPRLGRTRDRAFVAKTAALLVERDLGLLGTVTSEPDVQRRVKVELRGGELAEMALWVKKGDVFSLVRVLPGVAGQQVPWAVLHVEEEPRGGVCEARLYSRYRLTRASGLHCIKLGTTTGPLRLRLMQEKPGGALAPLESQMTVQFRRRGFRGEDTTVLSLGTKGVGDVDTASLPEPRERGRFTNLAFVSVLSGGTLRARMPVPILDERRLLVPVPAASEEETLLMFRVTALQRAVDDSYRVQVDLFGEIVKLAGKSGAAALERVDKTLKRSQNDHARLTAERDEVMAEVNKLPAKDRPSLVGIDHRLKLIKAGEADLLAHIASLKNIAREEDKPERKEHRELVEQGKLLEKQAEVEEALKKYRQALALLDNADLKKYVAQLEKDWAPKDDKHKDARWWIYKRWATFTTSTQLEEGLKRTQEALVVCKGVKDLIGVAKLRNATGNHVVRLSKELDTLNPEVNIDDQKPANRIKALLPGLKKLYEDAQEFLEKNAK
jgi:hypothetical protein